MVISYRSIKWTEYTHQHTNPYYRTGQQQHAWRNNIMIHIGWVSISNVAGSLLSTCMLTYPGILGMIDDTLLPVSVPFTGGPSFHKQCKLDICVGQTEKVGERNEWDHSVTLYFLLSQMYKKRGDKMRVHGDVDRTNGDLTGMVVLDERPW